MFRFFRPARRIFPSSRSVRQAYGSQPVIIHRVRLDKPGVNIRNVLISGAIVFGCYGLYTSLVLSPIGKWVVEQEKELTAQERKDMLQVEPLFIALPFTIRSTMPPPYKSTDPEWIEFIKISRDEKTQRKIKHKLASIVQYVGMSSAALTAKCGKDMKISRIWLEIEYPYGPPAEYDRLGFLLTDDAIELARRPVHPSTVYRTNRILWPSPMMLSTWAFAGTLFKQNLYDIAKMVGYEPKNPPVISAPRNDRDTSSNPGLPPTRHPDIMKAIQRIKRQATSRPEEVKDPRAEAAAQNRQISEGSPTPGNQSAGTAGNKSGESDKPMIPTDMFLGHDTIRSLTSGPFKEFRKMLAQKWRTKPDPPPRGCVLVSGMVEMVTGKASILVDVIAWFNPQTGKYEPRSVWMAIRRVQMRGRPLGH